MLAKHYWEAIIEDGYSVKSFNLFYRPCLVVNVTLLSCLTVKIPVLLFALLSMGTYYRVLGSSRQIFRRLSD